MKKIFLLIAIIASVFGMRAQGYTYQPWQPSVGPLDFMSLGDAQHPYIQTKYNPDTWGGYQTATTVGTQGSGNSSSHALITQNALDPCRCYAIGNNYVHEEYLPANWNDTPGSYMDAVVRVGCGTSNSVCNTAAQIEYWFYPTPEESILLVNFSFASQNVCNSSYCGHGVNQGCGAVTNPQFWIEVLDGQTGQLLDLGYYPTQASQGTANPVPNLNWPYSRFLAWPSGCSADEDSQSSPDEYGIYTFYWAGQNAIGYTTPTTFPYRFCPADQTSGNSSHPVQWFPYTTLAFSLNSIANQNVDANGNFSPTKSVKLRIHTAGCSAVAHWAYGLFTAKMIPGEIKVDACGDQDIHFNVPAGFMPNTYIWYQGNDSTSATPWTELYENTPGITSTGYDIYLDRDVMQQNGVRLYPYYRCEMKSYTGVPFIYEAHVKSYYIEPDFTFEQNFDGGGLSCTLRDASTVYSVTPPTQPGGEPDTVYQETEHTRWYVKRFDQFVPIAEGTNEVNYTFDSTTISSDGQATFKLMVQDETGRCADSVEKTIQLDISGEGVLTITSRSLTVTPNPTDGLLHVELTGGASIATVTLYDLQGRTIVGTNNHSPLQTGKTTTLNIRDLPAGTYLLRVTDTDGKEYQQKVIKK